MIKLTINRKKIMDDLRAYFAEMEDATRDEMKRTSESIRDEMREPGSPVAYPIKWDSEKQRRAFFATNGFGAGIPYNRNGKYNSGWTVSDFPNGYTISNSHPAGAIGGTISNTFDPFNASSVTAGWQSSIHKGRWKVFAEVAAKHISAMPQKIIDALIAVGK